MPKVFYIVFLSAIVGLISAASCQEITDSPMARKFATIAQKTDQLIALENKKLNTAPPITKAVGLQNCGNSCYMNAITQALLHSDLGRYALVPIQKIYFSPSTIVDDTVFKRFHNLAVNYQSAKEGSAISPRNFSTVLGELSSASLSAGEQEDASEFLHAFFNKLGTELNVLNNFERYSATDAETSDFSFFQNWVKAGYLSEYSIAQDLFGGYFKTILKKTDGKENSSYSFFTTLNLPIENSASTVDFAQIFANFSKINELKDSPGNKSQQILIYKAPKNLIIGLKRFEYLEGSQRASKIDTKINYPKQFTLVTPYDGKVNYQLYALTLHSGGVSGGHYWAYIKTINDNWFSANDSAIKKISETNALAEQQAVYLLFYKKI